ncbi:MAG: aminopeptidase P family N-terminal domain-containing protein, partial [Coxiellaceae bacterium]|nr:aminopeptidase P family N-terminal domain-containing protein [Coxiellaceae bacterium]
MIQERLKLLREKMQTAGIDYYYVPAADAHRNEYVPDCWQRRAWISGFTGSAGDALIGLDNAYLWTDGRYFLQAEQQLDPNCFQLMKQQQGTPPINEWLEQQDKKVRVGVDPALLTLQQQQTWQKSLATTNSELVSIEENLIDSLWNDQPAVPNTPILRLDIKYTGRETVAKLAELRMFVEDYGADSIVLTRLD